MRKLMVAALMVAATVATGTGKSDASRQVGLAERPGASARAASPLDGGRSPLSLIAARRTCKSVSSCREAVQMWCDGYAGADRDNDGIPCENVCHSKKEVDAIRAEIGC
tara:strand:+ start:219 stop:545 length:327 start_codon:yes stop_codon:yes gene_type:complete